MAGAVPGASGQMRLRYWPSETPQDTTASRWQSVTAETDCTHTFRVAKLTPATNYELVVEGRPASDQPVTCTVTGTFRTAPTADRDVGASFCVIACQDYPRRDDKRLGHTIYREMLKLDPDFMAHTGDTLYYDKPKPFAKTVALARFKWNRFYGLDLPKEFHRRVPTWFIKDDHDTLKNDCWPGQKYGELTFARGLEIYREQLPVSAPAYPRRRWGQHRELSVPPHMPVRDEQNDRGARGALGFGKSWMASASVWATTPPSVPASASSAASSRISGSGPAPEEAAPAPDKACC